MVLAVKLNAVPTQTGVLLPADGAEGVWLIVTLTVPGALGGHPPRVAVTEYVPLPAVVTPAIAGFCEVELKLFGPVQAYVAPVTVVEVRLSVCPEQTAELLPAPGEEGESLIITEVVPTGPAQPFTVTETE